MSYSHDGEKGTLRPNASRMRERERLKLPGALPLVTCTVKGRRPEDVIDFDDGWMPEPNTGCWLWIGTFDNKDYGMYHGERAHRVSYRRHYGQLERSAHVLHKCNTPSCVNPAHLELGRAEQNLRYCVASDRCGTAKLTVAEVIEIRSEFKRRNIPFFQRGAFYAEMAVQYGVGKSTVAQCIRKESWRDVAA